MNKIAATFTLIFTLIVGVSLGWWGHDIASRDVHTQQSKVAQQASPSKEGRFYVEPDAPFGFMYPTRANSIWMHFDDIPFEPSVPKHSYLSYSDSAIPTDSKGFKDGKSISKPALEVRVKWVGSTKVMDYINEEYPLPGSPTSNTPFIQTALSPYESSDHKFSGYFVRYNNGQFSGEAFVFKTLPTGCGFPPSDPPNCTTYAVYIIDNVLDMYTAQEFRALVDSLVVTTQSKK